jgi:hypothetical protein
MFALFWLVIIAIVAGLGYWLWRRAQQPTTSTTGRQIMGQPTLFDLQVGDIVQHGGLDWVVEGQLTYNDDGFIWLEYMLQDGDQICWLSVEEDDRVEVSITHPTRSLDIRETPPPDFLVFEGDNYRRIESGTARMSRTGRLRRPEGEECRYFDYQGPNDKVLSIEDWGGEIEVSVGETIRPSSLTLMPGQGRSVYN